MKIISGKYKGRKLLGYNIDGTRPTMDRVKSSLFDTIQDYLSDALVLDLFAGSGALGIEALSQGAKFIYFVDNNIKILNILNKNIDNINIGTYTKVIKSDYLYFLKNTELKFDIIFLDPPYNTDFIINALDIINKRNILNKNGIIVCESDNLDRINTSNYKVIKNKKYGDKYIVILKEIV